MLFEFPLMLILMPVFIFGAIFLKLRDDAIVFPMPQSGQSKKNIVLLLIKWLGIFLAIIALSSPYKQDVLLKNTKPSHSIITILDTSGSMHSIHTRIDGNETTWFDTAKEIGVEFLEARHNDHLGIVLFGTYAHAAAPLSYDTKSVIQTMKI